MPSSSPISITKWLSSLTNFTLDLDHICNICWTTASLHDQNKTWFRSLDGYDRPVCTDCRDYITGPFNDPFTDPPPELRQWISGEKEIDGRWRALCRSCHVRPEECRVSIGGRYHVVCSKCGIHLSVCRVHHVQQQLCVHGCTGWTSLFNLGDGKWWCPGCIKDIASGKEGCIEGEDGESEEEYDGGIEDGYVVNDDDEGSANSHDEGFANTPDEDLRQTAEALSMKISIIADEVRAKKKTPGTDVFDRADDILAELGVPLEAEED